MKHWQWLPLALLSVTLTACGESTVGVPVTGINYTEQGIGMYAVREPGNAERNRGGGEPLGPYSAGGIMCCYTLPREWHEGLQVELVIRRALQGETSEERTQDYVRRRDSGTLNEYILVDVPPYDNIEHSGLWIQLLPDDRYAVVVSDVDPRHKDWPGEVKGWPRPSDEYRRKLIEREIQLVRDRISHTQSCMASPGSCIDDTDETAVEAIDRWEKRLVRDRAYVEQLKKEKP